MITDQKIQRLKLYFGVTDIEDWQDVTPDMILGLHGVGPATLDQIRLYLAGREMTLKDDGTPAHWLKLLGQSRIGQSMTRSDYTITAPFTVLIDTQEQQPFTFTGFRADRSDYPSDIAWLVKQELIEPSEVKLAVPTEWRSLGASHGDYSIDGFEGCCHVERKSMDDAHGTFLGWGERRERFERELDFLAGIDGAAVVVECSMGKLLSEAKSRGKKSADENRKILFRQVLAWQQDYRIPFHFCDSRRLAEMTTFRLLYRFWEKEQAKAKSAAKATESVLETI